MLFNNKILICMFSIQLETWSKVINRTNTTLYNDVFVILRELPCGPVLKMQ